MQYLSFLFSLANKYEKFCLKTKVSSILKLIVNWLKLMNFLCHSKNWTPFWYFFHEHIRPRTFCMCHVLYSLFFFFFWKFFCSQKEFSAHTRSIIDHRSPFQSRSSSRIVLPLQENIGIHKQHKQVIYTRSNKISTANRSTSSIDN